MNQQVKTKADDTRARIMDTAEALFRRLGYAKTAVADIAGELRMSPANVYRFFPSKNAIVEAICRRCLSEVENRAWAVARSKMPAAQRLERLILEILAYHRENLATMFWGGMPDEQARGSLRHALYELRRAYGSRRDDAEPRTEDAIPLDDLPKCALAGAGGGLMERGAVRE